MKLFYAITSPFVRKVLVCAHELGIADRIERLSSNAGPVARDASIIARNPLGQVPTLILDDGTVLADSRVICEYLDAMHGGRLFPPPGAARWHVLADQSLADGFTDAALLARYEKVLRPRELVWEGWLGGQLGKISDALDAFELRAGELGERVDIGTIALGCGLGYLDFRFPDLDWRTAHPGLAEWYAKFGQRPSMEATQPA